MKLFVASVAGILTFLGAQAKAQYVDLSGTNSFIHQYVEENAQNWNKSILFVFYDSNAVCDWCPKAVEMVYKLYAQEYSNTMNIFEIDYSQRDEYNMRIDYHLTQPLSLVVVRINDGLSRGFLKIDNPQYWVDDPFYFNEKTSNMINNFLLQ